MYDRLTGGTTMIISSSGTTVPGSPVRPEYLKASVYLPPAFVAHHPDLHSNIIEIVQQYIETVGVRTVTMWTQRARHDLNYSLTQRGNPHPNAYFNAIPNPECNSAHYTFLGQPYKIIQDPSTTSVRVPSPDSSVASYDFGEDPDPITLINVDLQVKNRLLQDQINILQHKITDLEQVNFRIVHDSFMAADFKRAQDQIALLEGQLQRFIRETTPVSTPVRNVVAHVTPSPLRCGQMTPSRVQPPRAHTPSSSEYRSPGPHTPDTPSRRHGASSVSRGLHLGNSTVSRSIQGSHLTSRIVQESVARDGSNADELAPDYEPLHRCYINLYNLHHIAAPLDLIFNYTPAGKRTQELLKLGLSEDVCDALAKAMTLDNGMGLSSSGKDNN